MDDLREILTDRDRERALERFLPAWFDLPLELPSEGQSSSPRILERLWYSCAESEVFGVQDRLLPRSDATPLPNGWVAFLEENQNVWRVGYAPDSSDEPRVGYVLGDHEDYLLDMRLPEFVLRAVLQEAVLGAPYWSNSRGDVEERRLDEVLTEVFPPVTGLGDVLRCIPGCWTDGRLIVLGHDFDGTVSMFVGVQDLDDFEDSALPALCEWFDFSEQ